MSRVQYDDGHVLLDDQAVTLRRYYFPFATSKRIPYASIARVELRPLTWLTGKARGWGSTHPGYWLPLDAARARKSTLVVLVLHGYVKPAFTPDDPEQVVALLRAAGVGVVA